MSGAPSLETQYQKYKEQGFMPIYLIAEDNEYNATTTEDASDWANTFGLTFPVLADSGWSIGNRFELDNYIPSYTLIGSGMEVVEVDGDISDADIEALLD